MASIDELVRACCLEEDDTITKAVVDAILTHETRFFRAPAMFKALRHSIFPQLLKEHSRGPINIWSAACSYGQEPYSLAMMLSDHFTADERQRFRIIASDISEPAIERARAGVFSQLECNRGLPAKQLVRHFEPDGRNFRISEDLRTSISFRTINLANPFPALPLFHVILIRNTLLYLDPATRHLVLERAGNRLARPGWIVLGSTETLLGARTNLTRIEYEGYPFYVRSPAEPSHA